MPASKAVTVTSIEGQCRQSLAASDWEGVLTTLMNAYGRELYRYTWGQLRNKQTAEDVLQNVFIQAYEGLTTFEGRSTFRTWLYGIARHRCLDEIGRRRRWARVTDADASIDDVEEGAPHVESVSELRAMATQLDSCLEGLNSDIREIVLLRYRHDLSYEEIESTTGATAGSLRVRVCRALAALRRCLDQKEARV